MQAPEVMKEFEGDVKFGYDPKGILFFRNVSELEVSKIRFRNARYSAGGTKVVVETEFAGLAEPFRPFMRFVAEVDTRVYTIPDFNDRIGTGTLRAFDAVTSQVKAVRRGSDNTIYMESNSIQKQAYFPSGLQAAFTKSGVMFFRYISELKDKPDGEKNCVADYAPDRIVFHLEGKPNKVVAIFLPNDPIANIGKGLQIVKWIDTPPPDNFKAFNVEPEEGGDA